MRRCYVIQIFIDIFLANGIAVLDMRLLISKKSIILLEQYEIERIKKYKCLDFLFQDSD